MVKNKAWNALARILLVLNICALVMIIFLAGYYMGNKNSFIFEADKRGNIMIIRK